MNKPQAPKSQIIKERLEWIGPISLGLCVVGLVILIAKMCLM